jgi:hypothetical protein
MNPDTNKFETLTKLVANLGKKGGGNHFRCDPESNKIEPLNNLVNRILSSSLSEQQRQVTKLLRLDGTPVPETWSIFTVGEKVVIKNYTFKVGYIGESALLLEPVGPVLIGEGEGEEK